AVAGSGRPPVRASGDRPARSAPAGSGRTAGWRAERRGGSGRWRGSRRPRPPPRCSTPARGRRRRGSPGRPAAARPPRRPPHPGGRPEAAIALVRTIPRVATILETAALPGLVPVLGGAATLVREPGARAGRGRAAARTRASPEVAHAAQRVRRGWVAGRVEV